MAKNSNGPELTFLFAADIARFEAGINRIIAQLGKVEASINRASAGFNKLGTSSGVASNDVNRLIASLDRNKKSLDANTEAARRNSDAMAKLQSSFEKGRGAADQSGKSIGGVITGLRGLLAGYVGVDAVMRGGRAFIDNAVEVGRFEKVLETASGTQAAYAKNFQFLESVADEFRLNVIGLGKEFAALSVATRGTSLEGKETEKIFRATSMAASALQMSTDQTRLTFKAFTDMISKGVVSSEELKRQLGNHIPGAMAIAARAYGVTTQQMQKMLEAGTIMTTDFLPKMAAEMEKTFGKGAQSGAESLGNNIEYAKGQLALFFAEFGKTTGVIDGLTGIASGIGNISNQARKAMDGPLGQLFKYLSTANSLTLGVLTGDLGRQAANGLVDDVRRKMPGYKPPDTSDWYATQAEDAIKNRSTKRVPIPSGGGGDDGKKTLTQFEKLIQAAEKLRGVLEDQALKDIQAGKKFEPSDKTIEKWNKLYEVIWKTADATGVNIPNSLQEFDKKLNPPLKNLIDDDGNVSYGRPEKWEPTKQSNGGRIYDTTSGMLTQSEFDKLEIDVDKLLKNEDIYKVQKRLDELKNQIETKLIDTFGDLKKASEMGWGKVLESNKKGAEGINEATFELGGINKLSRTIKQLESELINTFGSLEEAASNGWAGVAEAIKTGSMSLEGAVDGVKSLDLSKRLQAVLEGFSQDAFESIGEILGTMAAGINADEANKRIAQVFGGLITNLGKALIAHGIVMSGIKEALVKSFGNPYVAIAAGVAAVAAGTALKTKAQQQSQEAAQRFWTGGIVDNPTGGVDRVHALLRPGEMVLNERQQNTLFRMLREGPGSMGVRSGVNNLAIGVTVSGRMRGMDMLFLQEKASKARARSRGKR